MIQKRSGEEAVLQSTIKRLKDKLVTAEVNMQPAARSMQRKTYNRANIAADVVDSIVRPRSRSQTGHYGGQPRWTHHDNCRSASCSANANTGGKLANANNGFVCRALQRSTVQHACNIVHGAANIMLCALQGEIKTLSTRARKQEDAAKTSIDRLTVRPPLDSLKPKPIPSRSRTDATPIQRCARPQRSGRRVRRACSLLGTLRVQSSAGSEL